MNVALNLNLSISRKVNLEMTLDTKYLWGTEDCKYHHRTLCNKRAGKPIAKPTEPTAAARDSKPMWAQSHTGRGPKRPPRTQWRAAPRNTPASRAMGDGLVGGLCAKGQSCRAFENFFKGFWQIFKAFFLDGWVSGGGLTGGDCGDLGGFGLGWKTGEVRRPPPHHPQGILDSQPALAARCRGTCGCRRGRTPAAACP